MKTVLLTVIFVLSAFTINYSQENETASVSGRVTTLRGVTLERAEVQFFKSKGLDGVAAKETLVKTVLTDKEGNYEIDGLPAGQYRVNFVLPTFGRAEVRHFNLSEKSRRVLNMGIPVGYTHGLGEITVAGQIQAANGAKLEAATVTLTNVFNPDETQQARTDKNGKYKITLIQPGQYVLSVVKPGYAATSKTTDIGNGAWIELNFTLNAISQKPLNEK